MIDGGDDSEYSSASETLNDDNYGPETTAKIRHSLSLNKEKVAPLATKYVDLEYRKRILFFFSALDGLFGLIPRSLNSHRKKTMKPVLK